MMRHWSNPTAIVRSEEKLIPTHVCKTRFKLEKKIGKGAFGMVYRAVDVKTGKEYAVKLESFQHDLTISSYSQLRNECRVYKAFKEKTTVGHFPSFIWFGVEGNYNILVMELLGPNLETLFNYCNRRFSLKTILMLGYQMLNRIEELHRIEYIHSDIKPDNFVMGPYWGCTNQGTVFLVDFGLAKRYISIYSGKHIAWRSDRSLNGTARYASISALKGIEQSRRDDLEGLCYVLLYFLDGALPWQGLPGALKEKNTKIYEMKRRISVGELYKMFPLEFQSFVSYCRSLKFEETPDYEYLRSLIRRMMKDKNYEFDWVYDWCKRVKMSTSELSSNHNSFSS